MQIYTETLTDSFSVQLPADLVAMLEIEAGDTVVFQMKGNHATISGLELVTTEGQSAGGGMFSEWASDADEEACRTL